MAFSSRRISLKFELGRGDFGENGFDTVMLDDLRCSVTIIRSGIGFASAEIQIYGMKLDLMNQLTVLNQLRFADYRRNQVTIFAGDSKSGMAMAFGGTIREAWVDARQAPDVSFFVAADSAMFELTRPVAPISFKGTVDAALIASGIAQSMGLSLENNGVNAQLSNPYLPGSPKQQIDALCRAIDCVCDIDDGRQLLAIWPKSGHRNTQAIVVSPDTGLVGYPSFTQWSVRFTTLYNPSFYFGGPVIVDSQLKPANGQWIIYKLAHRLESNVPGGEWFSDCECTYLEHQP